MSEGLYTDEIRRVLFDMRDSLPKGLVLDFIEYPNHLSIRVYRDNFDAFDGVDRVQISSVLAKTMDNLRKTGVPIYLEAEKNVPRRQ